MTTRTPEIKFPNQWHTWPGREPPIKSLGKSTTNIIANDLIWEFFCKHPMK